MQIGQQKQLLLNQIKNQINVGVDTLKTLVDRYDDLKPEDFTGYISDSLMEDLKDACRNPKEKALWNEIQNAPRQTAAEIQEVQRKVSTYIQMFPRAPKADEARNLKSELPAELADAMKREREKVDWESLDRNNLNAVRAYMAKYPDSVHNAELNQLIIDIQAQIEQRDWEKLERGNYNALQTYKSKYPHGVHLDEIDDLMWLNTKNVMNYHTLSRYLSDWPVGRHSAEANQALAESSEWEKVKHSNDLFRVDDYRDNHPTSPYANEINALFYKLREKELESMKRNPSEYKKDDVIKFIEADIFKDWELKDEGLITDESWETLQLDRSLFPNIQDFQTEDPNIQAPENCTDIYLFGTPGTGKTCLLMGLSGANGVRNSRGETFTLNMKTNGGPYASALQQYVQAGITPGRTFGKFVTTINGQVNEKDRRGNILNHRINLVEMSGEEFALRIADNKEVTLANMGTGATNLLTNDNRKVFFIIVDCSKDRVKTEYIDQVKDPDGNVIDEPVKSKYVSQLDILNKFVSLFELPENQDIMKRVDAIHFVVTKADMLGDKSVRLQNARELLLTQYAGPVEQLKNYCRQTRRINYSTKYNPLVFTFSLGRFYLGDVFSFDPSETIQIVDVIRSITGSTKEKNWWDRFKETIGG